MACFFPHFSSMLHFFRMLEHSIASCFGKLEKFLLIGFRVSVPPSSLTPAAMVSCFALFVVRNCIASLYVLGFTAFSMVCGGRRGNCARCAALEIAIQELKKIQTTCAWRGRLSRTDQLFSAEDDCFDYSVLDCEEGLPSTTTSTSDSSCDESQFWDPDPLVIVPTLSARPKSSCWIARNTVRAIFRGPFFRRWSWWLSTPKQYPYHLVG